MKDRVARRTADHIDFAGFQRFLQFGVVRDAQGRSQFCFKAMAAAAGDLFEFPG